MTGDLIELHLVLFSPGLFLRDKPRIAVEANGVAGDVFDGDPLILPIPEDTPAEVPRILLLSKDRQRSLEIASSRIALKLARSTDSSGLIELPAAFDMFGHLLQYASRAMKAEPNRVGFVTQWFVDPGSREATRSLLESYLLPALPFQDPAEIELHELEKHEIAGFRANMWTRIRLGEVLTHIGRKRGLIYLFDVNTLGDVSYEFDGSGLRRLLDGAWESVQAALDKHLRFVGGG